MAGGGGVEEGRRVGKSSCSRVSLGEGLKEGGGRRRGAAFSNLHEQIPPKK